MQSEQVCDAHLIHTSGMMIRGVRSLQEAQVEESIVTEFEADETVRLLLEKLQLYETKIRWANNWNLVSYLSNVRKLTLLTNPVSCTLSAGPWRTDPKAKPENCREHNLRKKIMSNLRHKIYWFPSWITSHAIRFCMYIYKLVWSQNCRFRWNQNSLFVYVTLISAVSVS